MWLYGPARLVYAGLDAVGSVPRKTGPPLSPFREGIRRRALVDETNTILVCDGNSDQGVPGTRDGTPFCEIFRVNCESQA